MSRGGVARGARVLQHPRNLAQGVLEGLLWEPPKLEKPNIKETLVG